MKINIELDKALEETERSRRNSAEEFYYYNLEGDKK